MAAKEAELQNSIEYWPLDKKSGKPAPFSLRCGALICDKGMPIRRAKALAKALNDSLKSWCSEEQKRVKGTVTQNTVQFHILESLDIPDPGDPDLALWHERLRLFPELARDCVSTEEKQFHVLGASLEEMRQNLKELRHPRVLPRNQLYRWLRMARDEVSTVDIEGQMQKTLGHIDYYLSAEQIMARLPGSSSADLRLRLKLLAEYWDYAWPFDEKVIPVEPKAREASA